MRSLPRLARSQQPSPIPISHLSSHSTHFKLTHRSLVPLTLFPRLHPSLTQLSSTSTVTMPAKKAAAAAAPAKETKEKKPAAAPAHASYKDMIKEAILNLKERNGSSRQAIKKYVKANNNITVTSETQFDSLFNKALKTGVEKGDFQQPKGPSGPVKLAKKEAKPAEKKTVKKEKAPKEAKETKPKAPKTKTVAKPKTAATKAKKATTPKKLPPPLSPRPTPPLRGHRRPRPRLKHRYVFMKSASSLLGPRC
ncbi:hypothetical protein CLAIMM_00360 [Cladophialophora immunda]|nr:hypothetical protein CLAIMM_00360 [Cladophialophora immunda]